MIKLLKEIDTIPNVPFLWRAPAEFVVQRLREIGVVDKQIAQDEKAVYVRIRRGQPVHQCVVDTHLDHSGIILHNREQGLVLGSLGSHRLNNWTPVQVFDVSGQSLGRAHIKQRRGRKVDVKASSAIGANSHAIVETGELVVEGGMVKMRTADNQAASVVAIELIKEVLHTPHEYPNVDLQVVFTFVEEMHQVSATLVAHDMCTPLGALSSDSLIIVLEAAEMKSAANKALADFKSPNYGGGPLIRVNDSEFVFGQAFPNEGNRAEDLLLHARDELGEFGFQHTVAGGSTDAKSFSLEGVSPHIACLVVPTKYKHNWGPGGEFRCEEFKYQDLNVTLRLLKKSLQFREKVPLHSDAISQELRAINVLTGKELRRLQTERYKIARSFKPRLSKGKYFGDSFQEKAGFDLWRVWARL